MTTTDFTNGSTLSDDGWFDDVDAVVYEQHGVGKTTVASATTPDIFAATVGHFIDYTGTATCTGFVAAVSAGSERVLYCAGACLFTAGANLLIEGITSGATITLAAGAIVRVYANTTTQFKITYSLSGSWTATTTGMVIEDAQTGYYNITNGLVSLHIPSLSGTSDATTFTITGVPAQAYSIATSAQGFVCRSLDNAGYVLSFIRLTQNSGTLTLTTGVTGSGAYTASGAKGFEHMTLTYRQV